MKRDTRRKILQYDGSVEHEVEEIIGVDGKAQRRIAIILYNSRAHVPPVHNEGIHPISGVQDMYQSVPMARGFPHSHVSVRVPPVGISVSH